MVRKPIKREDTVLIVEDDDQTLDLLAKLLGGKGYSPIKAVDGNQAIEIALKSLPSLAIVDLNLPDSDGLDVLRDLKAMDKDIPVIILTARGSQATVRKAMEIGAFDFLTKPFDLDEVCATVRAALESRPPKAG